MKAIKTTLLLSLALIFCLLSAAVSLAADTPTPNAPQTLCPVMNAKIDKNQHIDVDGKRIYVCCAHCIEVIKQDPQKYLEKLEQQGVVLEKAPAEPAPQG